MNIYMICTLWTPFQAKRDWKNSYREIFLIPLYIFYSLWFFVIDFSLKSFYNVRCPLPNQLICYKMGNCEVQRYIQGGYWGSAPPQDQWKLLISGGFYAPTGAESPLKKPKSLPRDKFLNTPLVDTYRLNPIILYFLIKFENIF